MMHGKYVDANRSLKRHIHFKAERMYNSKTFNPSSAIPGDTLYIEIPLLSGLALVPNTLKLAYDMEVVLDPNEPDTKH